MHKLKLDELSVESFSTAFEVQGRGTVRARDNTDDTCRGIYDTCGGGGDTCGDSCGGCGTYECATNGGSCGAQTCIYSCGYTACGNCNVTANEVGTCIAPCTVGC
jgi:hypothetical protein